MLIVLAHNLHSSKVVAVGAIFNLGKYNLLSRISNKLAKALNWYAILNNQIGKPIVFAKHVLSRESEAVADQYVENWKDYYRILRISPDVEPEAITVAYKRLAYVYHRVLSNRTKKSPFFSEMMDDVNEAYQVLSNPIRRTAYDGIYLAICNSHYTQIEEPTKVEILDAIAWLTQEVSKGRRRVDWLMPRWKKVIQQATLAAVALLLLMLFGGTSLAFAKPEHSMATPFKGIAITVTEAPNAVISLIEDIRGVAAGYERNIVSTALQSMRVIEGLKKIRPVAVSTNDMAYFPSSKHPLFPDYLDKRFSQFKYTVDSRGIVSVHTSGATTDALLEKIEQLLGRLAQGD